MKKVNPGAIKSGALLFKSLDAETSKLVYALVKQHAEETGSQFAAALLEGLERDRQAVHSRGAEAVLAMTKAMEEAKANNVDFPNAPGAWEKGVRGGLRIRALMTYRRPGMIPNFKQAKRLSTALEQVEAEGTVVPHRRGGDHNKRPISSGSGPATMPWSSPSAPPCRAT